MSADDDFGDIFGDYVSENEGSQKGVKNEPTDAGEKKEKKDKKDKKDKKEKKKDKEKESGEKRSAEGGSLAVSTGADTEQAKRLKTIERFFDVEAADDEDNQGEDEADVDDGFIDDTAGAVPSAAEMQRRSLELDTLEKEVEARGDVAGVRQFASFLDSLEAKFQEQEGQQEGDDDVLRDDGLIPDLEASARRSEPAKPTFIVPDAKDPKLWVIKCFRNGHETDYVVALLNKFQHLKSRGEPCPVYSMYCADHLRGFCYMEAHKESDVRNFVTGIRALGAWNIKLVPPNEMPGVFQSTLVAKTMTVIARPGDWCRIRRNIYANDLAMVEEVTEDGFLLKVKPRLDYEGIKRLQGAKGALRRPPQRFFSQEDAAAGGMVINRERKRSAAGEFTYCVIDGETYRDGYLYRVFRKTNLHFGDLVRPTQQEKEDFIFKGAIPGSRSTPQASTPSPHEGSASKQSPSPQQLSHDDGAPVFDASMPPPSLLPKRLQDLAMRAPLEKDDIVIVSSGDMRNLRGKVVRVLSNGVEALVLPIGVGETHPILFATAILRKFFQVGDHVKVVGGEKEGDTGFVVAVREGAEAAAYGGRHAIVISDSLSTSEFKCSLENLRLSCEVADPQEKVGEFEVGDVVRANYRDIGMLIRLEANTRARVLTIDGMTRDVGFQELELLKPGFTKGMGRDVRKTLKAQWTKDRNGHSVQIDDCVKAPRGMARALPIKALVKYIYNQYVFLEAMEEASGEDRFLVVLGTKVEFYYSSAESRPRRVEKTVDDFDTEEKKMQFGFTMFSDASFMRDKAEMLKMAPKLAPMGVPIRIIGGPYKGLRAEIRQTMGDLVRVSLLTKPKLVVLPVHHVGYDDGAYPRRKTVDQECSASGTPKADLPRIQDDAASDSEKTDNEAAVVKMPTDDDCWNPVKYLDKEQTKHLTLAGDLPEAGAQSAQQAVPLEQTKREAPASPSSQDSATKKRKTRAARLPGVKGEVADDARSDSGRSEGGSQLSDAGSELGDVPGLPDTWLAPGVAVEYKVSGITSTGWITGVKGDSAEIVAVEEEIPAADNLEPSLPISTRKVLDIRPKMCTKRGMLACVIEGPKRGARGKILGFEGSTYTFIRLDEDQPTDSRGVGLVGCPGELIKVESKDIALHSKEWTEYLKKMPNIKVRELPEKQPAKPKAMSRGTPATSANPTPPSSIPTPGLDLKEESGMDTPASAMTPDRKLVRDELARLSHGFEAPRPPTVTTESMKEGDEESVKGEEDDAAASDAGRAGAKPSTATNPEPAGGAGTSEQGMSIDSSRGADPGSTRGTASTPGSALGAASTPGLSSVQPDSVGAKQQPTTPQEFMSKAPLTP